MIFNRYLILKYNFLVMMVFIFIMLSVQLSFCQSMLEYTTRFQNFEMNARDDSIKTTYKKNVKLSIVIPVTIGIGTITGITAALIIPDEKEDPNLPDANLLPDWMFQFYYGFIFGCSVTIVYFLFSALSNNNTMNVDNLNNNIDFKIKNNVYQYKQYWLNYNYRF